MKVVQHIFLSLLPFLQIRFECLLLDINIQLTQPLKIVLSEKNFYDSRNDKSENALNFITRTEHTIILLLCVVMCCAN